MPEQTISVALAPTGAEKSWNAASVAGVELADLGAPVVADPNRIVTTVLIADGALTLAAQPDVPRNLTATLTDANDSASAVVTFLGLDIAGNIISDVMTIAAGAGKAFVSTKLYQSITSITVSGETGAAAGDEIIVGVGDVIALPKQIDSTTAVVWTSLGAVPVTPDAIATGASLSGVDANGATYNGTKIMKVAYRPGQ